MFERLGAFVSRHWLAVILFWGALAIGLRMTAPRWNEVIQDGDVAYMPEGMPSVEGEQLLSQAFPDNQTKSQIAVLVERPRARLTATDKQWVEDLARQFDALEDELPLVEVWRPSTTVVGDALLSPVSSNGQAAVVLLRLTNEFTAADNIRVLDRVREVMAQAERSSQMPPGLRLGVSGSGAIGGDLLGSTAESIKNTELATVVLVVAILLVVYRAPVLAIIPLATIGLSLLISIDALALLTRLGQVPGFEWWNFKIFSTTKIFIVVILFGAGTDFCLFLISRFKEELERGRERAVALRESVSQVGEALVGSALTTILGLGMMYFAAFGKFRNSGPSISLCLLITLVACLTLAPALVRACGEWVFWPFGLRPQPAPALSRRRAAEPPVSKFWSWAAWTITARPGAILVASLLLLAPLAYAGRDTLLTFDFLNELSTDRPSVAGTDLARRHFAAGEMAPVTLLAYNPEARFDETAGVRELAILTKSLNNLEGVQRVRSYAEPLGDIPGTFGFGARARKKLAALRHPQTKATYLTQVPELQGQVTRLDLVLEYDPFSRKAMDFLDRLDQYLRRMTDHDGSFWSGTRFAMVGTTVGIRDLKTITTSDQVLIQQLVVLAVTGVLIVILRQPVICIYLILSVLFSYYVTIGVTELVFSWWHGPRFDGLDWKVPLFLFVILIAVGEDYNIYLVTRVLEEQRKYGPLRGLRHATARTGGIITSCGVIMAGTFLSMMTSTLHGVLELGFALSLGVMLDTCVVRPVLVPAFIALWERFKARLRAGRTAEALAELDPSRGEPVGAKV
jgi:RND superfamily putative drug exporter